MRTWPSPFADHSSSAGAREEEGGAALRGVDVDSPTGAVALAQRGQHRDREEVRAAHVHVREAVAAGVAVGQASLPGEPRYRRRRRPVGPVVAVGAQPPEARRLHVDDVGLDLLQRLGAEAPAVERRRREVVGDHVRGLHQVAEDRLALGVAQVEADPPFADVVVVEAGGPVDAGDLQVVVAGGRLGHRRVPGHLVIGRVVPQQVEPPLPLDMDHVGPVQRQVPCPFRAGVQPG